MLLLITALLIVDSLHFIFARLLLSHISPNASVLYVLAISTIEVALFGLVRGRIHFRVLKEHLPFFLVIGFLIGTSTNINYVAVKFIDPGTAALLVKMSILLGLGFGLFWLREKLAPAQMVGALVAIAGVLIVTFQPGDYFRLGSLMVLGSTVMYALHAALVKRYGGEMDLLNFFFFRLLCTTGFLILFTVGRRALVWPSTTAWALLALTGTVDVVISRTLYYVALRRLKMSVHSVVLALSPVAAILWSLLLFRTVPTLQQLIGGAGVILGVVIVTTSRKV